MKHEKLAIDTACCANAVSDHGWVSIKGCVFS